MGDFAERQSGHWHACESYQCLRKATAERRLCVKPQVSQLSPGEARQLLAQNPPKGKHTLLHRALALAAKGTAATPADTSPASNTAEPAAVAAEAAASPDCAPAPPTAAQPRQLRRLQRYSSELPEAVDDAAQPGGPAVSSKCGDAAAHMDVSDALVQHEDATPNSGSDEAQQQGTGALAADAAAAEPHSGHADSEQAAAADSSVQRQQKRRRHSVPGPPAHHRPRSGKMRSLGEIAAAGPSSFPTASAAAQLQPPPQQQQQHQQPAPAADGSDASVAAQRQADQPPAGLQQPAQPLAEAVQGVSLTARQPPAGEQPSSGRKGSRKQAKVLALPPPDGRPVAELSWADAQAVLDANYKRHATVPYAHCLLSIPAYLMTADVLIGLHIAHDV